jgi:hypothetical protein
LIWQIFCKNHLGTGIGRKYSIFFQKIFFANLFIFDNLKKLGPIQVCINESLKSESKRQLSQPSLGKATDREDWSVVRESSGQCKSDPEHSKPLNLKMRQGRLEIRRNFFSNTVVSSWNDMVRYPVPVLSRRQQKVRTFSESKMN